MTDTLDDNNSEYAWPTHQNECFSKINHYPVDSVVYFVTNYPLDSDLSGG